MSLGPGADYKAQIGWHLKWIRLNFGQYRQPMGPEEVRGGEEWVKEAISLPEFSRTRGGPTTTTRT